MKPYTYKDKIRAYAMESQHIKMKSEHKIYHEFT